MEPERTYTDLVGILVGEIMPQARPLIFYLYSDPGNKRHTRCTNSPFEGTKTDTLRILCESFESVIVDVWCNVFYPCWYFVQVKQDFGPDRLRVFGLPWTVYFGWRKIVCPK